jgi:chorismate mutase / prephenate dehydratase
MNIDDSTPPRSLDSLRAEIDRVDDQVLALLGQRAAIVQGLRAAKGEAGPVVRPAREAALLRRLVSQAPPGVERSLILEVWRALIGASIRTQGEVEIVVAGATDAVRQFDLARRHFGAGAKISRAEDARAALARLIEGAPALAVLPWPGMTGPGGWWPILAESRFNKVGVLGALPIDSAQSEEPEAALVALEPVLEPAGGDSTFAIAFDPHYRLTRALADAHLPGKEAARARTLVLIRLDGFVGAEDPRLASAVRAGLDGLRLIGCFARI